MTPSTSTPPIDADLSFNATLGFAEGIGVEAGFSTAGFNKYGVRQNHEDGELHSIDVIFRAMQVGKRKEISVTPEFLSRVAANFSHEIPLQFDHNISQRANVGVVKNAWSDSGTLWLRGTIPNTGSQVRTDTIADFLFDPPAITDGSVNFGREYTLEYNDTADEYEFVDATLREFSLTPFPAGYDRESGGLSPAFAQAFSEATAPMVDDVHSRTENIGAGSRARISHARITDY